MIFSDKVDEKGLVVKIPFDYDGKVHTEGVKFSYGGVDIHIRNKNADGRDGKPIMHPVTVKIRIPSTRKDWLPITVSSDKTEIDLYKDANTPRNQKLIQKYKKNIKEFIHDNNKEISGIWDCDLDTMDGKLKAKLFASEICDTPGVKVLQNPYK